MKPPKSVVPLPMPCMAKTRALNPQNENVSIGNEPDFLPSLAFIPSSRRSRLMGTEGG